MKSAWLDVHALTIGLRPVADQVRREHATSSTALATYLRIPYPMIVMSVSCSLPCSSLSLYSAPVVYLCFERLYVYSRLAAVEGVLYVPNRLVKKSLRPRRSAE